MLLLRGILLAALAFSACTADSNPVFVTQTVYGFLDFTTTIGNTVMIFSPQSAPPPEPPKPQAEQKVVVNVIETKPNAPDVKKQEIQPSKTASKSSSKPKLSSVVQVVAAPEIAISPKVHVVASKVEVVTSVQKSSMTVLPEKKQIYSKVEVKQESPILVQAVSEPNPVYSSVVEVRSNNEPESVYQVGNNIGEPEYDFLSRQPSEFAEETYRVINLKPTAKLGNRRASQDARRAHSTSQKDAHPTGLVTKLSGSVVKDGVTTVHETSVIGTYISGKYAQVLQSSSHVVNNGKSHKGRISPSSTLRILKTAAPTVPASRHHIDPTPLHSAESALIPGEHNGNSGPNLVRASRRPSTLSGSFKNRLRNRNENDNHESPATPPSNVVTPQTPTTKKSTSRTRSKSKNRRNRRKNSTKKNKKNKNRSNKNSSSTNNNNSNKVELATVSAKYKPTTASYSSRRNNKATTRSNSFKTTTTTSPPTTESHSRRSFKPKVQASPVVISPESEHSSSLYKFKLNRTPGRWQYKTTPKPRVTIRKSVGEENGQATPPTLNLEVITNDIPSSSSRQDDNDLESSGSINGNIVNEADTADNNLEKKYPAETINVEISTPADFKNVYYELATIKSPYTFQVGTVKNTRYITVTSTFEKSLDPEPTVAPSLNEPLTENILAPSSHIDKEHNLLDSSIATLPPLYLPSDAETPPLETLTETFSTTQQMLKTHILPIIRDGANASSYTLIQTYHVTRLVTATKTLPPMDAYQFVPSKRLKEFNTKLDEAGSELHLELEFGDDDNDDDEDQPSRKLPADLDLANIGTDFDLFDVDRTKLEGQARSKKKVQKIVTELPPPPAQSFSPEHLQQLAFLRLINPAAAAQIPQVITTSKPIIKLETVYESHVIPIINGVSTSYSTISRPVGTVSKTEFEIGTSMLPGLPIQQVPVNPLFQQPQQQQFQQFQITTAPIVTQTVVTQTQSKVLKLTFGAKTAYTTLFSTNVVPTLLTTYVTTSVPVQQTAAFPGFYPQPYAPFPFVG